MPDAAAALERWLTSSSGTDSEAVLNDVRRALDDDLDTPTAVAAIDQAARAGFDVAGRQRSWEST